MTITHKVAKPLAPEVAARLVSDLGIWHVHRPGVEDILDAIHLQERYQLAFWDAMIVTGALQLHCHCIWSEDLNLGQVYDGARVMSPFSH
ncbi:MAG: hypothetical protein H5T69_05165 [Chloroflexi bacterium]|nr:hypothetical protein [Chloroflexota bacterium]